MDYLDFELEIGPGVGRIYPIAVLRSPAGEAGEKVTFPFGELELENRLQALRCAAALKAAADRCLRRGQAVQDFGRALLEMLFSGEVRSRYDVSQREAALQGMGLRLKLRVQPPELAALPWEFLYDARNAEYVCLSRNTPLVRYLQLPHPVAPLRAGLPLRILGMAVSPNGLPPLDIAIEKQRVETALASLQKARMVSLSWLEGQTWRDLQRAVRYGPWHVFHFIGHGGGPRDVRSFMRCRSGGNKPGHAVGACCRHRDLRLAVLNTCEGAGQRQDVFSARRPFWAPGLPAVLAMQYPSPTSRHPIRALFMALADGRP